VRRPRTARWRRALQLAAAAAIGAVAVLAPYSALKQDDAQLGALYRQVLEQANGVAFLVLPLEDSRGRPVGQVYGYEGRPSWVLVAVSSGKPGRYRLEVETLAGRRLSLGSFTVVGGRGSLGRALPVDFFELASIRVSGPGEQLVARVPPLPTLTLPI